jgi:hypothetical protein
MTINNYFNLVKEKIEKLKKNIWVGLIEIIYEKV